MAEDYTRRWGSPELSCLFTHSLPSLLPTAPGVPPLRWDSGAGGTYSHPTALLSLGSLYELSDASRDERATARVPLQFSFLHFCFWSPSSPILPLVISCLRITIPCLLIFIPFGIFSLSLLFKKDSGFLKGRLMSLSKGEDQ